MASSSNRQVCPLIRSLTYDVQPHVVDGGRCSIEISPASVDSGVVPL